MDRRESFLGDQLSEAKEHFKRSYSSIESEYRDQSKFIFWSSIAIGLLSLGAGAAKSAEKQVLVGLFEMAHKITESGYEEGKRLTSRGRIEVLQGESNIISSERNELEEQIRRISNIWENRVSTLSKIEETNYSVRKLRIPGT